MDPLTETILSIVRAQSRDQENVMTFQEMLFNYPDDFIDAIEGFSKQRFAELADYLDRRTVHPSAGTLEFIVHMRGERKELMENLTEQRSWPDDEALDRAAHERARAKEGNR